MTWVQFNKEATSVVYKSEPCFCNFTPINFFKSSVTSLQLTMVFCWIQSFQVGLYTLQSTLVVSYGIDVTWRCVTLGYSYLALVPWFETSANWAKSVWDYLELPTPKISRAKQPGSSLRQLTQIGPHHRLPDPTTQWSVSQKEVSGGSNACW